MESAVSENSHRAAAHRWPGIAVPAAVEPFRGTFLFVALYFLVTQGRIHLILPVLTSIPLAMIAGILAVAAFLFEMSARRVSLALSREEKLVLWLVALCFITLPTSVWRGGSFVALYKGFLPTAILMLITSRICTSAGDIRKLVWLYILNSLLIVIMALTSNMNHFSKGVTDMYDVNDIAFVLDCALPIIFYLASVSRGWQSLVLKIVLLVIVVAVVKTESRGGILGLAVFGCYLVYVAGARLKYILAVAVAALAFALLAPETTKERVQSMINPQTEYDKNLGDRTQIWKRGVKLFLNSPLLGVGLNNYTVADGEMRDEGGSWRISHNSLLLIAVELGAAGLFVFVKLVAGTFLRVRKLRSRLHEVDTASDVLWVVKGVEGSLLVYMVTSMFLSQAFNPQMYFIISLFVAAQRIVSSRNPELSCP